VAITADVYQNLRDAIFSGELRSGQRLDVQWLATTFEVSNQPVKEALNRLALEGLVVIKPRSGTFVRTLTVEDMDHILDARLMIETHAVRSMGDPDAELLNQLEGYAEKLAEISNQVPFAYLQYNEADIQFHEALIELSGNPELIRLYRSLHSHYVTARAYFSSAQEKALANESDHHDIVNALKAGERRKVINLVESHILSAKRGIAKVFKGFD
jgi:DNA-binding GntR family transcriptional regulator